MAHGKWVSGDDVRTGRAPNKKDQTLAECHPALQPSYGHGIVSPTGSGYDGSELDRPMRKLHLNQNLPSAAESQQPSYTYGAQNAVSPNARRSPPSSYGYVSGAGNYQPFSHGAYGSPSTSAGQVYLDGDTGYGDDEHEEDEIQRSYQ